MNASSFISRQTFSVCRSCRRDILRRFSTTRAPRIAFQSYPLSQPTTPSPSSQTQPRNAGVPDTSIAFPVDQPLPRVHETRPPKGARSDTSVREGEAQKSEPKFAGMMEHEEHPTPTKSSEPSAAAPQAKTEPPSPTQNPTTSTAAPSPTPPKRSKLRAPRKAAIKLTPAAVSHLRDLLDQPEPQLIKIGVRNRGCSGLAYSLEYVDKPGPFDEVVEQDGVKVLIDSKALFSIIGSEMGWVEDKLNERFYFNNPNIKEQCGCGESFMV